MVTIDRNYSLVAGLNTLVNEAAVSYAPLHTHTASSLDELLEDKLMLSILIRQGLTSEIFETVYTRMSFSEDEWALFLGISLKSIQRYRKEHKRFKPTQSEKILEITEVFLKGEEIFGDADKFKLWLSTDSYALGGHKPMDLLTDSYGKELVLAELVRIDHGIFV